MGESDNIPGNYTTGIDLNNGGWILIGILIFLVVFLFAIIIYLYCKNQKTINKLQESFKPEITEEERNLLSKYRNLNDIDKTTINNTINALNKNQHDNVEPEGRN